MCLIISSEFGNVPEFAVLKHAYNYNPHGWGVAYFDGQSVKVDKGISLQSLIRASERVTGLPYIIHFRYATHGRRNRANTHPFKLVNGAWMAHNGVIRIDTPDTDRSDTAHFADLLSELITASPNWFGSAEFVADVSAFIGASNKLAFIDRDGGISHIHKSAGVEIDGMWFSNSYSLPYWYTRDIDSAYDLDPCAGWEYEMETDESDETDSEILLELKAEIKKYGSLRPLSMDF